jgi:hypothetical protein
MATTLQSDQCAISSSDLRGRGPAATSCTFEAQLEDETPFERHCLAKHGGDACQKPIEHEELTMTGELCAGLPCRAEALFESLLERKGRRVRSGRHGGSPP